MKRLVLATCLAFTGAACVPRDEAEPPEVPLHSAATLPRAPMISSASAPLTSPVVPSPWFEFGRATYYSDRLAGHRTANGERYDPSAFTAAHKTLPLGSIVDVVRSDGRWVRVRVNDRGPFAPGRVVDLSRRAAAEIGLLRDGVADVALRVVYVP